MASMARRKSVKVRHRLALDVGGTLAKLLYFEPFPPELSEAAEQAMSPTYPLKIETLCRFTEFIETFADEDLSVESDDLGGKLRYVKFETKDIEGFVDVLAASRFDLPPEAQVISATGGGSFKHEELFKEKLGVTFRKRDELATLIKGLNYMLRKVPDETYVFHNNQKITLAESNSSNAGFEFGIPVTLITTDWSDENVKFPYLLVNIGSGVSILKVQDDDDFERVSGTSLGGGTFFGLAKLLTGGTKSFDEILESTSRGDHTKADLSVGDIFGDQTSHVIERLGLNADSIASFFGKVAVQHSQVDPADSVSALLRMISYNIGQIAYLNAVRFDLERIFFVGSFIRDNPQTMAIITEAVKFWSANKMTALFTKHEGFFGTLGAFLMSYEEDHATTL